MIDTATELTSPDHQVMSSTTSNHLANECVALVKKHCLLISFAFVIGILIELYLALMVAHFLDELFDLEAATKFGVDIEAVDPPYKLFPQLDDDHDGSRTR
ncbi:hypothetical protein JCM3766R1_004900 [Sporobolomyces carnicolor]